MTGSVKPYCFGRGCSQKLQCCRHKEHIDVKKEDHFPVSPNKKEDECGWFVGVTANQFKEQLKSSINGTKTDSFREDGEDSGV